MLLCNIFTKKGEIKMKKKSLICSIIFLFLMCLTAACQTEKKQEEVSASASAVTETAAEEASEPEPEPVDVAADSEEDAEAQSDSGDRHTFPIERLSRSEETPMGDGDKWTIFMYVCGTDLESDASLASMNLQQIMQTVPSEGINVVVQTGGTRQWGQPLDAELAEFFGMPVEMETANIDPDMLQRYVLTDTMTLVDEQPLASMGSGDTLYDFLSWGVENYPAEKMGVIFWDHGGSSLMGVCVDELFEGDALMPFEMEEAFERLYPEMTDRFEFIGFDACLMANIEMANILVPHARYMYGSEEIEPGFGWDYTELIGELNRNPEVDGSTLGKVLCDAYFSFNRELELHNDCTLSVTDLEKVDEVLYALDDLALDLSEGLENPGWLAKVSRNVTRAENYTYDFCIDLGDMADNLSDLMPEKTQRLKEALDEAVVYSVSGSARAFASGLSVYYPTVVNSEIIVRYGLCAPTPAYYDYISGLQYQQLRVQVSGKQLVTILDEPAFDEDGRYGLTIDPSSLEYVRELGFMLYLAPEGEDTCFLLGYDSDMYGDLETGRITDNFEGDWFLLDGEPLMVTLEDYNSEYSIYTAPIVLNGEYTQLKMQWIWDDTKEEGGYVEILGTFDGSDPYTQMASRAMRPLQAGDKVSPLYILLPLEAVTKEELADPEEYLDENGEPVYVSGSSILIREDSEINFSRLDPGTYLYQFNVTDIYGEDQTYAPASFELDDDGQVLRPRQEELPEETEDVEDTAAADEAA